MNTTPRPSPFEAAIAGPSDARGDAIAAEAASGRSPAEIASSGREWHPAQASAADTPIAKPDLIPAYR